MIIGKNKNHDLSAIPEEEEEEEGGEQGEENFKENEENFFPDTEIKIYSSSSSSSRGKEK